MPQQEDTFTIATPQSPVTAAAGAEHQGNTWGPRLSTSSALAAAGVHAALVNDGP